MRNYELRKTPEEADRYARDIDKLMPKWYKDERKDELERGLRGIAQIALPSCLELLQEGFGKTEIEKNGKIKWDGHLIMPCPRVSPIKRWSLVASC